MYSLLRGGQRWLTGLTWCVALVKERECLELRVYRNGIEEFVASLRREGPS
jgi:hypothetical protein